MNVCARGLGLKSRQGIKDLIDLNNAAQASALTAANGPSSAPLIQIQRVTKRFGDFVAVNQVDLEIRKGEFFALLGASGCGKTTLLRMLGGFETPSEGRILIDGVDMSHVPPYERPVNMMFQSYALFPHMTVAQNVAFGLYQDGMAKAQIIERVGAMLDMVQMSPYAKRKPAQLSGGQRQRVALARCLAKEPKVLLLDEPLGALDKKLREQTQLELVNIQDRVGITFIMVTHDQEEAMTMASRVGIMKDGAIAQIGTPFDVYETPNSRFVGDFIGNANMIDGVVEGGRDSLWQIRSNALAMTIGAHHDQPLPAGSAVTVMVRPEKMIIGREASAGYDNHVSGTIKDIAYLGDMSIYHVRLPSGQTLQVSQANLRHGTAGKMTYEDKVVVSWQAAESVVLLQ
jgi:putrescine transport system ATP-binding protein